LTAGATEVVDRIIAVVNDEIIVLQEVNNLMETLEKQINASGYSQEEKERFLSETRDNYIAQLVNRKLIVQAANELEWLTVGESEIDASLEQFKQQNDLTDEKLLEDLEKEGLTLEEFRTQLKESSLISTIESYEVGSRIVITEEDVTQYYNSHPDEYHGQTTYHLRNIFLKAPVSGTAANQEAVMDRFAKISSELESGVPFENLARKYSENAYADEGGELGNFKLKDLTPNLRAAIEPLSPGQATGLLEASDGYQILYVEDIHKEADVPLDSVYSEIETELYKQQYTERRKTWIDGLRENAHIKIIE
jgi:peptidyl-prolyl cis-trans isomerase SurA